jgi:hypothetical protein
MNVLALKNRLSIVRSYIGMAECAHDVVLLWCTAAAVILAQRGIEPTILSECPECQFWGFTVCTKYAHGCSMRPTPHLCTTVCSR